MEEYDPDELNFPCGKDCFTIFCMIYNLPITMSHNSNTHFFDKYILTECLFQPTSCLQHNSVKTYLSKNVYSMMIIFQQLEGMVRGAL